MDMGIEALATRLNLDDILVNFQATLDLEEKITGSLSEWESLNCEIDALADSFPGTPENDSARAKLAERAINLLKEQDVVLFPNIRPEHVKRAVTALGSLFLQDVRECVEFLRTRAEDNIGTSDHRLAEAINLWRKDISMGCVNCAHKHE